MDIKIIGIIGLVISLMGVLIFGNSLLNEKSELIFNLNNSLNKESIELLNLNLTLSETKSNLNESNSILNIFKDHCENSGCNDMTPLIAINFLKKHNIGSNDKMYKNADSTKSLSDIYNDPSGYNAEFIKLIKTNCPEEYFTTGILSDESKDYINTYCNGNLDSCDERVKERIKATVESQLTHSEYSSSREYLTQYNPDITKNEFKERAIVFFDKRANIICAFKFEKKDYFSDKEEVSAIN